MERQRIVIPYSPRDLQRELHENRSRFVVLVCHRRFGKTVWAINELIKCAISSKKESFRAAYIAPLYKQAKSVAWDYLKKYAGVIPGVKFNEAELRCDFPWGARIALLGADNPDSLRGIYLDDVVLDEVAQMPGRVWREVIRPAISDRQGSVVFIGTPSGHNFFYDLWEHAKNSQEWSRRMFKASETEILPAAELVLAMADMSEEQYEQEFECSFQAAIIGAYYGKLLTDATDEGRICSIPHDPAVPVNTYWDLGISDSTAIWFAQQVGREVRLIDYYEHSGVGLEHYVQHLQAQPYTYGKHFAPHDIKVRELGSGKSRLEIAGSLGVKFEITPKIGLMDGINAARLMLPRCLFDETKCRDGLEALMQYRSEYDDRRGIFRDTPLHDWTSHAADSFRYFAVAWEDRKNKTESFHRSRPALGQGVSWMGA